MRPCATAGEAAALDDKTRVAWAGHPHHRVVDNSTGFEDKVWRVTQEVVEAVGLPTAASHRRRFLVDPAAALALIDTLPADHVTAGPPHTSPRRIPQLKHNLCGSVGCVGWGFGDQTGIPC